MAVPNTTTFTMDDVFNEVGYLDLVSCFFSADSTKFDSAYEGSKDRLSNFRNYGATPVLTEYTIARGASISSSCVGATTTSVWQVSNGFNFTDTMYSNALATFPPSSGWYSNGTETRVWNGSNWVGSVVTC